MCEALHTARVIDACFRCTGSGQVLSRGRIHQLVAATQHSRETPTPRWTRIQRDDLRSTKCKLTKAMQKGLDGAVAGADMVAHAGEVNFEGCGQVVHKAGRVDKTVQDNACRKVPYQRRAVEKWDGQLHNCLSHSAGKCQSLHLPGRPSTRKVLRRLWHQSQEADGSCKRNVPIQAAGGQYPWFASASPTDHCNAMGLRGAGRG